MHQLAVVGFLVTVLAIFGFALAAIRRGGPEKAFVEIAWLPGLALLLMYLMRGTLERAMGYGILVLLSVIMILSVGFSALGLVLIARAGSRRQSWNVLLLSTVAAAMPALLLVASVVFR